MKRILLNLIGALVVGSALNLQVSTAHAEVITFANPTPEAHDFFGLPLTAVGSDRVLIGAHSDNTGVINAGAAYLFTTNGALLTTITNPTPAFGDGFGWSVAVVGIDRVLIGAFGDDTGATNAGAAYLFTTNGALLTTITKPTPVADDQFGLPLTAFGSDRVLIGANGDDTGATNAGAAYLFSTNGALLTTLTNPTPAADDLFGGSMAAVGSDRILIGESHDDTGAPNAGAAHLFNTNGMLLTTITNPTPAADDNFSSAVAAVGNDRVLIGAGWDDTGATNAGAAYLFGTSGVLLVTFTNPVPGTDDWFGSSVVAVGSDRVLIGAGWDDTGATNAGAAYLFSTSGALLTTFTNPAPAIGDIFGASLAAAGTNGLLIGAHLDDMNATDAGVAYLFTLEPSTPETPLLSIALNPQKSTLTLSWPAPAEGWVLERTNALPSVPVSTWPQIPPPYETNASTISVTFTNPPSTEKQFFRLHKL